MGTQCTRNCRTRQNFFFSISLRPLKRRSSSTRGADRGWRDLCSLFPPSCLSPPSPSSQDATFPGEMFWLVPPPWTHGNQPHPSRNPRCGNLKFVDQRKNSSSDDWSFFWSTLNTEVRRILTTLTAWSGPSLINIWQNLKALFLFII